MSKFKPAIPPRKRPSPDDHSPSKRFKHARHPSPDRGETSSEVDPLNIGRRPTKHPLKLHPPLNTSDFPDLTLKPLDDIRTLLSSNQDLRAVLVKRMTDHLDNPGHHDVILLSLCLSQVDDRIRAVKQRIAVLEARHPPPPPPPPVPTTSAHQLLSSTPISDTTVVNVGQPPISTQDTVFSPDTVELDLDISARTLVVGDSDDAYYDKFDPIPLELAIFSTDAPKSPIASTSASAAPKRIDHTSSPYYTEVMSILKNTFKLSLFRANQLECIIATLDAKDVFYLAPTGGGKSLCFQLPALCVTGKTQGTTFVISPLISLITDQVAALRKKGVPAFPLTSAAEENEVRQVMRMMRSNIEEKPKLVYTTPERLQKSDSLREVVDQLYAEKQLARFVIDEAHVIGSWGRDFRVSYAELNILRNNWPDVPIMALTGSANKDAIQDIKRNLAMRDPVCLAQSFNRPNLHYSVRKKPSVKKDLVQDIAGFIKTHHPDNTGIVYALSRADSEDIAKKLREDWKIEARHYHAGVGNEERKINQDDWTAGNCKVIVATIAFGMGIDKPDVRFVIHATLSKDMDGYYQETGRAGRDGRSSDCVLCKDYTYSDVVKIEKMLRNPVSNDPTRDKPCDAEIERQVVKLSSVTAYCCNETDCRRVLLLRHFDEVFNPEDCHDQCDNCHRPGTLTERDLTAEGQQVIRLLQDMINMNSSRGVTQSQLKDTWKGKNNKAIQPYKGLALYASGKSLSHPTIERIYNHLLTEGIITTYSIASGNGYSNAYIRLGSNVADYLGGGKRLVLSWKEIEEVSSKRANGKPTPRRKGKEPDSQPRIRFLDLYEDIEDADGPSESEVLKEVVEDADVPVSAISRTPQAGTSRSVERVAVLQSTPVAAPEDVHTTRLERLKETRRLISKQFRKHPEQVLQDDTLEILALTCPKDEQAFRCILVDLEGPDEAEDKWSSFGKNFMAALQNPFNTHRPFDTARMRRDFAFNG